MLMEESFRWFGPNDPVSLQTIRQTGATGVVTSLHQIPYGEVWTVKDIMERKEMIERAGLTWSAVESLPVHENIKTRTGNYEELYENYRVSLRNLGRCGLRVITYNFMPVLDWIRTDLNYELEDGSRTLFFNRTKFAAFDICILGRKDAEADYAPEIAERAKRYFAGLSREEAKQFELDIVDNFPGFKGVTLDDVKAMLSRYADIGRAELKANHKAFLNAVCPAAEEAGCQLVIHPDDPPFPLLGLPRIFSTAQDITELLAMDASPANGICFCTGSFSGRAENDLVPMFRSCADRVGFVHLRSTEHTPEGNFYEANHLEGVVDMYNMVKAVVEEQIRRIESGRKDWRIVMRPDHGHVIANDLNATSPITPGYSALGRMRGLAELRGLEFGILKALYPQYLKYCPGRA